MTMRRILVFVLVVLVLSQSAFSLVLSPSELKIKNIKFGKNYQFILLITSEESGLRNFELKSSQPYVKINPSKFMLSQGEKKSVRLSVAFPSNLEPGEGKILVQPYINEEPSTEKLRIIYTIGENPEEVAAVSQDSMEPGFRIANLLNPEFYKSNQFLVGIVYGLIIIVSILIVLFILPDIRETTIKINKRFEEKLKKLPKDKESYKAIKINKRDAKKVIKLEKKMDKIDKNIQRFTDRIERFIDMSNDWLRSNSEGKYGLE